MGIGHKPGTIPLLLLLLLLFCPSLLPISIDNDILGEPDIECLDQEIRVWIKTRKYFQGRIYAKGKADDPECAKDDFSARRTKKVHFDLGLGRCGMKNLRSYDPRGMYYGITLVVSFHPMFITKVDQAFHVKCFFEEANRGLTAELGVSMIPTTEVEARHGVPGCTYSIHKSSIDELDAGKPAGGAIQFAKVGDKVLHQWHCDDQMFGVLINNCFVTDGVKQKVQVIDNRGCPMDPILITGIRYSADLQRAYAESQVFKFADRPGVWFFCQIQMCMKKDGMCDGLTPPSCAGGTAVKVGTKAGGNRQPLPGGTRKGAASSDSGEQPNTSGEQQPTSGRRPTGPEAGTEYDAPTSTGEPPPANGRPLAGGADYEPGPTGTSDYEAAAATVRPEYTSTKSARGSTAKQRANQSGGYGPPAAVGYDQQQSGEEPGEEETATAFGPGYAANQVGDAAGPYGVGRDPPGGLSPTVANPYVPAPPPAARNEQRHHQHQHQQEVLSTEFEAEDDLRRRPSHSSSSSSSSSFSSTANTPLVRPADQTAEPTTTATTSEGTIGSNVPRKDYVDYEADVTIPPHLTDLLASLQPEDINAQNLQRMFRDAVPDRRTLLQGFDLLVRKMKQQETKQQSQRRGKEAGEERKTRKPVAGGEESHEEDGTTTEEQRLRMARMPGQKIDTVRVGLARLARDSPMSPPPMASPEQQKKTGRINNAFGQPPPPQAAEWRAFRQSESLEDPPVIAGQLLIYDLDETPPASPAEQQRSVVQAEYQQCVLTRHGLTLLGVGSASLLLILLLLGLLFVWRFRVSQPMAVPEGNLLDCGGQSSSSFFNGNDFLDALRREEAKPMPVPEREEQQQSSGRRRMGGAHQHQQPRDSRGARGQQKKPPWGD